MPDESSTYHVGIIAKPSGLSKFAFQSSNPSIEADEYEVKDENGNTIAVKHKNHRVKISVEAIIPKAAGVPVPGQTISMSGFDMPSVDEDGEVSGSFGVNESSSTSYDFKVNGTPSITQSNTDWIKCSFEAVRYLVNGIPGSPSSSSSASSN
ncbi:MAG: hypothetical protein IJS08_09025 [Victivallales bacterium]|nr:hypothetical protein [Victivallales bacterium]